MNHKTAQEKLIRCIDRGFLKTLNGFTLVEVVTVLVIISLLAIFAAPEVNNWRPKMRLKRAADTLTENLQLAKMHAIKNNVKVVFTFTKGAGTPCTGGNYLITESPVVANIVANVSMVDKVCLHDSDFVAGDGFTSRGLPINAAAETVKLRNADLAASGDPTYEISQSVAGGLSLKKESIP